MCDYFIRVTISYVRLFHMNDWFICVAVYQSPLTHKRAHPHNSTPTSQDVTFMRHIHESWHTIPTNHQWVMTHNTIPMTLIREHTHGTPRPYNGPSYQLPHTQTVTVARCILRRGASRPTFIRAHLWDSIHTSTPMGLHAHTMRLHTSWPTLKHWSHIHIYIYIYLYQLQTLIRWSHIHIYIYVFIPVAPHPYDEATYIFIHIHTWSFEFIPVAPHSYAEATYIFIHIHLHLYQLPRTHMKKPHTYLWRFIYTYTSCPTPTRWSQLHSTCDPPRAPSQAHLYMCIYIYVCVYKYVYVYVIYVNKYVYVYVYICVCK